MQIIFDGSEDAITYQCAKHRSVATRTDLFKLECAKHDFKEEAIHHLDYDEDVFACIQFIFAVNNLLLRLQFMY